jgi:multiple sugar transport system ATP-binding protein
MARIVLQDVTKRFGKDVVAVDRVSMEIPDGEFMVLVGPSGCGKTTLLRIIAGLEDVTDGEVVIGDRIVTDLAPKDRDVAMVFQNYALYPHMTVAQNIAIGLKIRKRPKAEVEGKVADAAAILGLEPLLERKPGELSGGQRQRVAMGRASRCRTSTPSCGCRCAQSSPAYATGCAQPRCTSRTTRSRR